MKKPGKTEIKSAKNIKKTIPTVQDIFFIVGIGASAGGLEALKLFFANCPPNSGMSFVIVQHLDPTHKSLLTELISRETKMNVFEIKDGVKVNPNCVYIIPPNKSLTLFNQTLQLANPEESRAGRRPIDQFFHSLAEDLKDRAIGIVLSGTGTEGSLGLKDIKAEGGCTLVQDPATAQFTGMPQNAIIGQAADFILPPERMPDILMQYITKRKNSIIDAKIGITIPVENQLNKLFQLIRNKTSYDFSNYKTNTIVRRITKRMALNQVDSLDNYITYIQKNTDEVEKLYMDFLIGVTSFFRDPDVFTSIEINVIPYLIENCKEKNEIRVWVSGCSTGEEAYSLAILFRKAQKLSKMYFKVLIFASDIDKNAIEFARTGTYPESIFNDVSKTMVSEYFNRKDNRYQLKKEIREMVVFAHHNLIKDPPFSKMDLITCRNLLIYMNSELQKKILAMFNYSLNNEGILVLGTSESIGEHIESFADFDKKNKIFIKKTDIMPRQPKTGYEIALTTQKQIQTDLNENYESQKKLNLSGLIEKYLLDQYSPAAVIIDKENEVIYFSGNTGEFLQPPTGIARLNIMKMAKQGLNPTLKNGIEKARASNKEFRSDGIDVKVNDFFKNINLIIKPVLTKESYTGALMILFETADSSITSITKKTTPARGKGKPGMTAIEKELKITQENLQATLNELDLAREDLQSSNEEFQSSNEELQSSNEELETSREELQSVNEELITVNNELENKIDQLSNANNDLTNLLSSIDVATIFLDRDLKIKRFTASATKIFNLIPTDIDRPVTNLTANISYNNLANDVNDALKTLAVKTAEVQSKDGDWYQMRIIPYRTSDNIIEGVLVTFIEITDIKMVEEELKKSNEHLNLILENLPAVPFTLTTDPALKFSFVGKSCEKVTGFLDQQFMNKISFWSDRIHPDDKKNILSLISGIAKKTIAQDTFRWKTANGKYKYFTIYMRYTIANKGRNAYIVGIWQEIIKP